MLWSYCARLLGFFPLKFLWSLSTIAQHLHNSVFPVSKQLHLGGCQLMVAVIGTSDECDKSIIHSRHFIYGKERNSHFRHSKSVPAIHHLHLRQDPPHVSAFWTGHRLRKFPRKTVGSVLHFNLNKLYLLPMVLWRSFLLKENDKLIPSNDNLCIKQVWKLRQK